MGSGWSGTAACSSYPHPLTRLQRNRSNSGGAPLVRDEFDLAANEKGPRTVALVITAVPEIEPKADGGDAKAAGKE